MAIYMQIKNIKGDVTAKGYENWIELDSINLGVKKNIAHKVGTLHNRQVSLPSMAKITATKKLDRATPLLFSNSCQTKSLGEVHIHICRTGSNLQKFLTYKLSDVIISSYDMHGIAHTDEDVNCQEHLALSYGKIEVQFIPRDSKNQAQSPITAGYDLDSAEIL